MNGRGQTGQHSAPCGGAGGAWGGSNLQFLVEIPRLIDAPAWIAGEPQFTLSGTEMLQRGEVPLGRVDELLGQIEPGRFILLVTNFEPTPIIEAMQKQNCRVFHKVHPEDAQLWLTFIQ